MTCDQVFMVLTAGPFPTGRASDVEVERHLERCIECWRFAEALRPAQNVFEESVPPIESRDLPGYWGDAIPARSAIAQVQQTALRTTQVRQSPQRARVVYYDPPGSRELVGWREVVRIASFLMLVGSAAFALAWLWQ